MSRTALALWALVALATTLVTAILLYVHGGGRPPIGDEWLFTEPSLYLTYPLQRHNVHPFLLGRLFLAADYYLANASGDLARFFTVVLVFAEATTVTALARLLELRERTTLVVIFCAALVVLLNPVGWHNLTLAFQTTFILAFALAPLCFMLLTRYLSNPNTLMFAAVSAAALAATQSLAWMFVLPALMLAMALRFRASRRLAAALALIIIIGLAANFATPTNRLANEGGFDASNKHVLGVALFALKVLGLGIAKPLTGILDLGDIALDEGWVAALIGATLLGGTLALAIRGVARNPASPAHFAALLLVGFALFMTAAVAAGRSEGLYGGADWRESRYAPFGALLLCCFIILSADTWRGMAPARRWIFVLASGLAASMIPLASFAAHREESIPAQDENAASISKFAASLAMRAGFVPSPFIVIGDFHQSSERLRAAGKWHFADPWASRRGETLQVGVSAVSALPACGRINPPPRESYGPAEVSGVIDDVSPARGARSIVIANAGNVIVGYGRVPRQSADLTRFLSHAPSSWSAFAPWRELRRGPLTIYAANERRVLCRIGSTNPREETGRGAQRRQADR
jgi:hypothetical protein